MTASSYGWVAGLSTLAAMLAFVAVVAFNWSARRRPVFERAARLPLEEDSPLPGAPP